MAEVEEFVRQQIPRGLDFLLSLAFALLVFLIGKRVIKVILNFFRKFFDKREMEQGVVSFLISAIKIGLYALLVIIAAQIMGLATSSVVAVIGSAGLALGLALQGSLANFAGGVLILFMKPFVVDDYIIVGEVEGRVKKIDVVYTTLLSNDNRAIILPNGKLADSNIINATREDKRRIDIEVGIAYTENIGRVRDVLRQITDSQKERLTDMPVDIVVSSLDESCVTMAVHMWVKPECYWQARWRLLEEVRDEFEKNQIEIPYNRLDVSLKTDRPGEAE